MTGGPLDGLTVRLDRDQAAINTSAGRYVRTDPDEWNWETDTMPYLHPDATDVAEHLTATSPLPVQGTNPDAWLPGDPCHSCGSTRTVLDVGPGVAVGVCLACGRSDEDE